MLLPLKTEISPGEKEDLELLERALEKAFCVRTGTGHRAKGPHKPSATLRDPCNSAVPPKDGRQTPAAPSGKQVNRMTCKSGRPERKEQKKTGLSTLTSVSRFSEDRMFTCPPAYRKKSVCSLCLFLLATTTSLHHASKPGSLGPQRPHTSGHCSNEKSVRSSMVPESDALSENDTQSRCDSDRMAASHGSKSAAHNVPQESRCVGVENQSK